MQCLWQVVRSTGDLMAIQDARPAHVAVASSLPKPGGKGKGVGGSVKPPPIQAAQEPASSKVRTAVQEPGSPNMKSAAQEPGSPNMKSAAQEPGSPKVKTAAQEPGSPKPAAEKPGSPKPEPGSPKSGHPAESQPSSPLEKPGNDETSQQSMVPHGKGAEKTGKGPTQKYHDKPPQHLTPAAVDRRLRRVMAPRSNGEYKVPEQAVKDWKNLETRPRLMAVFEKCGYMKDACCQTYTVKK